MRPLLGHVPFRSQKTASSYTPKHSWNRVRSQSVKRGCEARSSHGSEGKGLRNSSRLSLLAQVERFEYQGTLLDAIAVERSGIKGMRLIIDETLVEPSLKSAFRQTRGSHPFGLFTKLENSAYPDRVKKGYCDVLWML